MTIGFERLIADLGDACARHARTAERAAAAVEALANSLRSDGWLPQELQQPESDGYRREIAHVAEDGSFTLMVMTWLPGQTTPIHDHIAWCAVGLYRGNEQSVDYSLRTEGGAAYLVPRSTRVWNRGECEVLIPPAENIHRVTCVGEGPAVSLHVYGADIRVTGSSIQRCYDDIPVRERAEEGAANLLMQVAAGTTPPSTARHRT